MRESFVQYVWDRQLFDVEKAYTVQKEKLKVLVSGIFTGKDGPDFFNAQLYIGKQLWAGNVEIHLKASDWFAHRHEFDARYDTVILHVVWEYDVPVLRNDGSEIPVFEIKNYVRSELLEKCTNLFMTKKRFNCEDRIHEISDIKWLQWKERLFIERLEGKVIPVVDLLAKNTNDWQFVFMCFLAKGFGSNANGDYFLQIMLAVNSKSLHKHSDSLVQLEAIFLGVAGLLEQHENVNDDQYVKTLKLEWQFLKEKFALSSLDKHRLQFFQLRPSNFPTIRLAQLAAWFFKNRDIIQALLTTKDMAFIYQSFDIEVGAYWNTHYVLNSESKFQKKKLTKNFIDLIYINTIVPMQFAYSEAKGEQANDIDEIIDMVVNLNAEKNAVISSFTALGVRVNNALDSQSLLELKKYYCDQNRCLNCMVGKNLVKD